MFTIGASIGLVTVDGESHSVSEVLSAGDGACYAAKAGGRSRVEVYERQLEHPQRPDERDLAGMGSWRPISSSIRPSRYAPYFPTGTGFNCLNWVG